jgi:hypothetical protein
MKNRWETNGIRTKTIAFCAVSAVRWAGEAGELSPEGVLSVIACGC